MDRTAMLARLEDRREPFDIVVIGGGATGVGVAVDAAARGHAVLLLEQLDFGQGTSSRSTKLVHGGVRYLQQGNVSLVMEALKERGILRENAPHLVRDLRFIVPNYAWWEAPFYGIGMKVYDMLAGRYGFGPSRNLSREKVLAAIPTLETDGLRGGVQYYDGQFDDARLLIGLARTAAEQGAVLVNHCRVVAIEKDANGFVRGVVAEDRESGREYRVRARGVVNATGPFADGVLKLDDPESPDLIAPSQGIHLVFDRRFLPGDSAIMVPRTSDGRVLFAIPWHGHALVGTTDTPIERAVMEPAAREDEVQFVLGTAQRYLATDPTRADVKALFVGIRPLVRAGAGVSTAQLSRDHTIHIGRSGLVTIVGGKWTTYRNMAEDVVDHVATLAQLDERPCTTRRLRVHGYHAHGERFGDLAAWGSDAPLIDDLVRAEPELGDVVVPGLPYRFAQVVFAVRTEMARTVEDVLSRRIRALLLDARGAVAASPRVAALVARELGRDADWCEQQVRSFATLARHYLPA
ncbi:MAG: glycerol-3-phosphate dehydrogenase/oxidase [Planctomycetes bacterium]|nr:glycerol-3-phosphate dehydrogenase/oxidase [Planctomycetota bacterium]